MDTLARTPTIPTMAYLGVDPGLSGAWAVLSATGRLLACSPIPRTDDGVDAAALAAQWRACPLIRRTAVELVHAMPGQGVTSMFTFGEVCGCILGVLGALGLPAVRPTPQRWQKALGVQLPANCPETDKAARRKLVKARASALAGQLLGEDAARLTMPRCRTVHDGLVDAVLIAEWLRRGQPLREAEPWDA